MNQVAMLASLSGQRPVSMTTADKEIGKAKTKKNTAATPVVCCIQNKDKHSQ